MPKAGSTTYLDGFNVLVFVMVEFEMAVGMLRTKRLKCVSVFVGKDLLGHLNVMYD